MLCTTTFIFALLFTNAQCKLYIEFLISYFLICHICEQILVDMNATAFLGILEEILQNELRCMKHEKSPID